MPHKCERCGRANHPEDKYCLDCLIELAVYGEEGEEEVWNNYGDESEADIECDNCPDRIQNGSLCPTVGEPNGTCP